MRDNLAYIPDDRDGVSLVHGDFKPSNLLVDPEDGHVTGVLDWEFAFAGSPLFDLATLLRESANLPPDFEDGVIEGYKAAGANYHLTGAARCGCSIWRTCARS